LHREGPNVHVYLISYDGANQWKIFKTIWQTPYCDMQQFSKRSIVIQTHLNAEMKTNEYAVWD